MPSPIAHLALALSPCVASVPSSSFRSLRVVIAVAVASLIPDADLLLVATLEGGIVWHHGPSHSLLGAALLGAAVGLSAGVRGRVLGWGVVAAVTHPLLDWQLGEPGGDPRFGVPLLWPILPEKMIAASPIFRPFHIHEPGFVANMFRADAVGAYLREVGFAAVVMGVAWVARVRSVATVG